MKNIKKIINLVIMCISCFLIIYMIGILIYTSSFSVFAEDDFAILDVVDGIDKRAWVIIKAALEYVVSLYVGWQGTYLGAFLWAAINPVSQFGLGQLRVIMVINSTLFFASLILFIYSAFKCISGKINAFSSVISTALILALCGYETYPEVFFWFSGSIVYSFPMSFFAHLTSYIHTAEWC